MTELRFKPLHVVSKFRETVRTTTNYGSGPFFSDNSFDQNFDNFVLAEYKDWDWKRIIAEGGDATTTLSATRNGFSCVPHIFGGKQIYERPSFSGVESGTMTARATTYHLSAPNEKTTVEVVSNMAPFWGLDNFTASNDNLALDVESQAKTRHLNAVIKCQRKFDSLVFGGELRESLSLLLQPGRAVRKALDEHVSGYLKKGIRRKFGSFKQFRRFVQERWLEFTFGIKPLLSDVHDAAEALASHVVDRVPNRKVTSSAKGLCFRTIDGADHRHLVGNSGVIYANYTKAHQAYGVYIKYMSCIYNPNWANGITAAGLGFDWRNVVPAIYELIPYSFLVDYFSNLGSIINYFSYGTTDVRWTNRTLITHSESYWDDTYFTAEASGFNVIESFIPSPGVERTYYMRHSVNRGSYFGNLYPGLRFEIPNALQWLNIAALIDASDKIFRGELKGIRL